MNTKIISIACLLLLAACSTIGENSVIKGQQGTGKNKLLSLSVSNRINDIPVSASVAIKENKIRIFFPPRTNTKQLIPEFQVSEKTELHIRNKKVKSGQSKVDFNRNFNLTVRAENGDENQYEVITESNFTILEAGIHLFMDQMNIPGAQVAIMKNEKLVYLNAFGFSDKENHKKTTNDSLFRIASISKPITAVAILKLVEKGKLRFNQTVFGEDGILKFKYGIPPYPQDVKKITVKHLLDHQSGWTNNPYDTMFKNVTWGFDRLISEMIDNRPLAYTPGSETHYLNFGYCLLGRIIEQVTGNDYTTHVKQSVLKPIRITEMKIAGNTLEERSEKEVKYYDQEDFSPYAMNVTRMDAHGGWIATAEDLMKFMRSINLNDDVPDILPKEKLNTMYFGDRSWKHTGSLPGTSVILEKVNDRFSYAFIINTRKPNYDATLNEMQALMREEIHFRKHWPQYDLFMR